MLLYIPIGSHLVHRMEVSMDGLLLYGQKNSTAHLNTSLEVREPTKDIVVTSVLGAVLVVMCLVGMSGNTYTLVVMNMSMRFTGSMYIYIVNLALADLLYLSTIPFVVCTYFVKNWYFGDIGCRILFSLDLLTMHASIFILTIMSTERYLAVVKPLDSISRSRDYRRTITCLVWLVSFLLALPTMILIDLRTSVQDGVTKQMCHPTWQLETYKIYLTILFHTCILAPGLIICYLYFKMAKTYWKSQSSTFSSKELNRCPRQKVLYMIFSIVLTYWACFIPFWVWQLLSIYLQAAGNLIGPSTMYVNFVVTCLAYSNSCINPFLYTLLSKNYKEYLRSRHKIGAGFPPKKRATKPKRSSSKRSVSSGSHFYTETVLIAQLNGPVETTSAV